MVILIVGSNNLGVVWVTSTSKFQCFMSRTAALPRLNRRYSRTHDKDIQVRPEYQNPSHC